MDNGRQVTTPLKLGMRFNTDTRAFKYKEVFEEEDEKMKSEGKTNNQRMARICKDTMNSINPDLVFTTESPEDVQNERLPTLDFELWMSDNKIRHFYFQKEMKTPFVIMERSGIWYQQKFQILTNELVRRMSNIQLGEVTHREVLDKVEQFNGELKNFEYLKQAKEIVTCGLRGLKTKRKEKEITSHFID